MSIQDAGQSGLGDSQVLGDFLHRVASYIVRQNSFGMGGVMHHGNPNYPVT